MEERKELMKEYYDVLKTNQLKLMEISGVDLEQIQGLQAETSGKMKEIAESFHNYFLEAAPIIAEVHKSALTAQLGKYYGPYYYCIDPPLETALDCQKSAEVLPPEDPSHAKGEVECDLDENLGRLYLELHGMGPGVPVSGTVTCSMIFSHKDDSANKIIPGNYTISALVQANGYQLMQLWGCASCGGSAPSTVGHLKITARMCVAQLFDEDWSPEYVLLDTTTGGPPASIDLNAKIKNYTNLIGGSDADIKVEFKIEASIDGCGQIYVDLKTSEFFYFKVPMIDVCRRLWWYVLAEASVAGIVQRFRALWEFGGILHMEKAG